MFPSDRIPKVTKDVNVHFFIHNNISRKLYQRIPGTFEAILYKLSCNVISNRWQTIEEKVCMAWFIFHTQKLKQDIETAASENVISTTV